MDTLSTVLSSVDTTGAGPASSEAVVYSLESVHWFCSAAAQMFAALTALVGLFAVYKLQQIRADRDRSVTDILEAMFGAARLLSRQVATEDRQPKSLPRAFGHTGRAALRAAYVRDYRPALAGISTASPRLDQVSAAEAVAVLDGLFVRVAVRDYEMVRCRWWAILATVVNALTALAALVLLYLFGLSHFRSVVWVTLLCALCVGALSITLAACIDILTDRDLAALARQIGADRL